MRVKNRLLNFENMIIYQDDDYFLFSLDSVLLANFVTIKLTDKRIIDLCTGNAPIPMLLSLRTKARIFGVELQQYIYDMGVDSIRENNLQDQITLINANVKEISDFYSAETFDIVTCNPPYFKYKKDGLINKNIGKAIARHEIAINLEEIVQKANYLLKNGGTFAMIHRPERLIEIIELLKKYNFEPKKIQLVYPKKGTNANMLMIEATKNGNSGLKILGPVVVYDTNGEYFDNINKMFGC